MHKQNYAFFNSKIVALYLLLKNFKKDTAFFYAKHFSISYNINASSYVKDLSACNISLFSTLIKGDSDQIFSTLVSPQSCNNPFPSYNSGIVAFSKFKFKLVSKHNLSNFVRTVFSKIETILKFQGYMKQVLG